MEMFGESGGRKPEPVREGAGVSMGARGSSWSAGKRLKGEGGTL